VAADVPSGFVGRDHRAAADLIDERRIGRLRPASGTLERLHEATGRHRKAKPLPQERGDLADREPELFVQDRRQRDRIRAQLSGCGIERIGRLQWVAALDTGVAAAAAPDVHVTSSNDRTDDGQIFLILNGDAGATHASPTLRTRGRQRGLVGFVDVVPRSSSRA
jgi:hypothetical protein